MTTSRWVREQYLVWLFANHGENWRGLLPHRMHQNVNWGVCSTFEDRDEPCHIMVLSKAPNHCLYNKNIKDETQETLFVNTQAARWVSESQQNSAFFVKCHGKLCALVTENSLSNLKTCTESCLNNNPSLTDSCIPDTRNFFIYKHKDWKWKQFR